MRLRRWAYRRGFIQPASAGVGVISVGNITTGGTGKTPMVAWIVRNLLQAGRFPSVLIRGYKSIAGLSDEAKLLAELCRPAPIMVNPDRIAGARQAVANGADVLVADDAFSHLRLRRDLNIVLIDATCPFGFGWVLPGGLLREPLCALKDADAIVITRCDQVEADGLDRIISRLRELSCHAPICRAVHAPAGFADLCGVEHHLSEVAGKSVFAFCGIGNPGGFFRTLEGLGGRIVGKIAFEDHAAYPPSRLAQISDQACMAGAELLVTTRKDAVKLSAMPAGLAVWTLRVEMEIIEGRQDLLGKVLSVR